MNDEATTVRLLEDDFFTKLYDSTCGASASVDGNISIVHTGLWWCLYMFAPEEMPDEKFNVLANVADATLASLLARTFGAFEESELCKTAQNRVRTVTKQHCYYVWIPVKPNRLSADFARFFPDRRP